MGLFQSKSVENQNIRDSNSNDFQSGNDYQQEELENELKKVKPYIYDEAQMIQKYIMILNQSHDCLGKKIRALCVNFYYSPRQRPIDQSTDLVCSLVDIDINNKKQGYALLGMIVLPRLYLDKFYIIMIDKNKDIFRVGIDGLTQRQAQLNLGLGQFLHIKNPVLTLDQNGCPYIHVNNPYEVIAYDVDHNLYWMQLQIIKEKCKLNFQASYLLQNFLSSIKILCLQTQLQNNTNYLQREVNKLKINDMNDYLLFLNAQTMAQYNIHAAINIYQELIIKHKDRYSFISYFMMLLYYEKGDYLSSIDIGNDYISICERDSIKQEKEYAYALYIMGCSYRAIFDKNKCEIYLLEAVKLQPNNSRFLASLGCYYYQECQFQIALDMLKKSVIQEQNCLCFYQECCYFIFICYFQLKKIKKCKVICYLKQITIIQFLLLTR